MTTVLVENNGIEANSFIEYARTLPFVTVIRNNKMSFEEACAECYAVSVDFFIEELEKKVKERYAQEISPDILDSIKTAFQSKPVTITVEEDDKDFELTAEMKIILDKRLQENGINYLTAEESISQLNERYGL